MNAVEKALRHIEKLIAARASPQPSPRRKPAKRRTAPKKRPAAKMARVVSRRRRHRKPAAYNPVPAPVDQAKLAEQQETFAAPPTPPEAPGPITHALWLPPVEPSPSPRPSPVRLPATRPSWADAFERDLRAQREAAEVAIDAHKPTQDVARISRGSCKAVDADTGRQCRKLEHPEDPDRHRSERGPFHCVLQPGAVPRLHEVLDAAATRQANTEVYNGASHVKGEGTAGTGPKRRGLASSIEKHRRSAEGGGICVRASNVPPAEVTHRADGCTVYRGCVILPDGELLDDVLESEAQRRTEGSAA